MTFQQIAYVIALDNYKNFQKASESCFVSQPTLSMQVNKLEDEIGFKIFNREKKPIEPTALGETFILKARVIMREVDELKALVSEEKDSMKGEFSLGIIPTLSPYLLPILLPAFSEQFPETRLNIDELQSESIIHQLKHGLLDIGILATPLEERSLRETPVFYEPFLVYLNSENELADKNLIASTDLEIDKILLLSEGHCFRNQTLNICSQNLDYSQKQFNYKSGAIETIKALVNKGLGYTLVPELSVLSELRHNKNIKRFEKPEPVREVSIVVHSGFSKERLIDNMRKVLLEAIPASFAKNERFVRIKWR